MRDGRIVARSALMNALPSVDRYLGILDQLLFERAAAGGDIPDEDEARFAEQLDDLWWQLTAEERQTIDAQLIAPPPAAVSEEIRLVDDAVSAGAEMPPRRAA